MTQNVSLLHPLSLSVCLRSLVLLVATLFIPLLFVSWCLISNKQDNMFALISFFILRSRITAAFVVPSSG